MNYKYIYGPVPSRRMGLSLGVSPLLSKYCNYSCVYCQLGLTNHMTNTRDEFIEINKILDEFKQYIKSNQQFDVVTIVGEGEPTLYLKLGELIKGLKKHTDKPVAVITNGALLYDMKVQNELVKADIVLPSLDAYNKSIYKKINRPFGTLKFEQIIGGLKEFSSKYKGQLWIEIMLMNDINDSTESICEFKKILDQIRYDRLYINTPARPPAEKWVKQSSKNTIKKACEILGGISIENLVSEGFGSNIKDDIEAVLSIISRHPMNQFEISSFLKIRNCEDLDNIFNKLNNECQIEKVEYKGYITYRKK